MVPGLPCVRFTVVLLYIQIVVWACGAHNIGTEPQVTVQVCHFVHSGFMSRNWSKYLWSKSHHRFTRDVHKWCIYVNDTSLGVDRCKCRLLRELLQPQYVCISNFWVLYFEVILGHNVGG